MLINNMKFLATIKTRNNEGQKIIHERTVPSKHV